MQKDTIHINVKTRLLEKEFLDNNYSKYLVKSVVSLELTLNNTLIKKFINPEIIHQKESCEHFYPATCTCEVPGCAGLHAGFVFRRLEKSIEWKLPEEDIEDLEDYQKIGFKKQYIFEIKSYLHVLEQTQASLEKLSQENPHLDFFFTDSTSLKNFLMY